LQSTKDDILPALKRGVSSLRKDIFLASIHPRF
jgi:hypothetical protein